MLSWPLTLPGGVRQWRWCSAGRRHAGSQKDAPHRGQIRRGQWSPVGRWRRHSAYDDQNQDCPEEWVMEHLIRPVCTCVKLKRIHVWNALYNSSVVLGRGRPPTEPLPDGWIMTFHNSGIPVYLHRETRVVTWSRPYFLGTGSIRVMQLSPAAFLFVFQVLRVYRVCSFKYKWLFGEC